MTVARATFAVAVHLQAGLVNTEMAVLLALVDLLQESIVAAPLLFGQSNYVSGYPNEEMRC